MTTRKYTGAFVQILYSPHGGIEGLLMRVDDAVWQFVLDKDDEKHAASIALLKAGQTLVVAAEASPSSAKGAASHPVLALRRLVAVDGAPPPKAVAAGPGYSGKVVALNYARHGAPNGVVLDSGDFVHLKPDGFARLGLKIGDRVDAEGDAHFLATGQGWAVEATSVNGQPVKSGR